MTGLIINRVFAHPTHETFKMKPVKKLLHRYVKDGKGWVDMFAGRNSPAEITNDINPEMPTDYHMEAVDFCNMVSGPVTGVLFDPPYSYRQICDHYRINGRRPNKKDTSYNFYRRVIDAIYKKIIDGGYAISFGWNSTGFTERRGFRKIEILLIGHGLKHNDTIVLVEQKVQRKLIG